MTRIIVTPARAEDLPEAAGVLAEAFSDDPVIRAIAPREDRRAERLVDLFHGVMASGSFATGTVDLARREGEERIVGVASWEGPGAERGAFGRQVGQLPRFVRALGWSGIPRALRLLARLGHARPRSPHWYLAEIGVSAEARGLGVGSALLDTHLEALDAMRQAAYLESSTPDNRRLYRRAGFMELGPISGIPGARPARMLRAPGAGRLRPAGAS